MTYSLDKTVVAIASLEEESDDRLYWQTQTPLQRLEAIEFMRQVMYGYDPSTARLQRVLEFAELARE
jgi:hypothetical protein